jgi:hypothetical protein
VLGWRLLQALALAGLVSTAHLVFQASPAGPTGEWQIGRLMYAGAGAISALTLLAVGSIGVQLAGMKRVLAGIEVALARRSEPTAVPPEHRS